MLSASYSWPDALQMRQTSLFLQINKTQSKNTPERTEGKKREWPKKRVNYAVRNYKKSDMGKTDQKNMKETEAGK